MTAIMAIGTAGLIGITRNTHTQSVDTFDDTRVFLAAEAGLHIGTRWYRTANPTPQAGEGFNTAHMGIPVMVELMDSDENPGMLRITSTANLSLLPYTKMLEWTVTESDGKDMPSGRFGYFIDDANNGKEARNFGNYQGFRATSVFDCPVHFNGPLWIKNNDSPIFRGLVSLFNPPSKEDGGDGTGYYNRYDPNLKSTKNKNQYNKGGLSLPNGSSPENYVERDIVGKLDDIFQNKLEITDQKYQVTFKEPPAVSGPDNDGIEWWILPASSNGINSLRFNGTTVDYVYSVNTVNPQGKTVTSQETITFNIPQDDSTEAIIHADFPLTVTDGHMTGVVSVRTTDGNDLHINLASGKNLTYTGVTVNGGIDNRNINYGLGNDNRNLLAFYSGNNLYLDHAGNHTITAQLMAKAGQVVIPNFSGGNKNYTYEIVGNMIARYWWNYSNAGTFDDCIKLWHDQREMNAPGVTLAGDHGGDGSFGGNVPMVFEMIRWRETNIPR
jgi:hypothetical protein